MSEADINPQYAVVPEKGAFGILGKEETTGETVLINKISAEEKFAFRLAEILNKNKVSVHHAKDILRDILIESVL